MAREGDVGDVRDVWIQGPAGRLFSRIWSPPVPDGRAPIVMLHDSLGSVELWRDFPSALCAATRRNVIAYDRLGFGQSDPHPGRLSLGFIADEALSGFSLVREQLRLERFVLFGHSVGGGMAVNCAAHYDESCLALITESAQAFVEDRTVRGIEDARESFTDPNQAARLRKYHGEKAAWVLGVWIESWLHPEFSTWSLVPTLPRVKCPTLVIHGEEDEYGSPSHPRLIAELAGGSARLEILPLTRHVPHRERADEVLGLACQFLDDIE